jgi:hypothetical protein
MDPMIVQQWQAQQLMHMPQQMVHMHRMIEMLQEENRTLNSEKSNSLKMAIPNMDIRELEQQKEMLHQVCIHRCIYTHNICNTYTCIQCVVCVYIQTERHRHRRR